MFWCFGKKVKNHHCKIVLLDETEFIHDFQETSKGQQILDVVFKHLNLMETAYFGLRYLDSSAQRHWLDPNKNIIKQLKGLETFTFYFGVKFYASDPCKLLEEITRYQFFLQVKQDIYQGRLSLTFELAAELFAYAIQSELGDYDPRRHHPSYPTEFRFCANQMPEMEAKAADIHKTLAGRIPAVAEMKFLERVKWLDMYGVDLHPVLGEDNIEYFLALTPSGILVLRNKSKVGNYFWPRITKSFYKRKYFMIRVRDKNNEENTYGFELPNKEACKHLWKCCLEHRAFFKLTQIKEIPGQSNKVMGLENKFLYSGRADKNFQMCGLQARLRTPPTFIRMPSRRFQKRLGQPDGADAGTQANEDAPVDVSRTQLDMNLNTPILIPSLHRATSVPSVRAYSSPYRAPPWDDPRLSDKGVCWSGTNPSPRSVRSAGALPSRRYQQRCPSIDSAASYDYRKRRHHQSNKRQSDNESEISKSSRCSKSSRSSRHRRHGSHNGDGSDSETHHRHRRHSRRKKHGSTYELVDSENQWREVQVQTEQQSQARMNNAVVRNLSKRKSGYLNSGLETESETNYNHRRRHRRHRSRSRSPDNKIPSEVKKYIEYNLVDPTTLTEEEKKDIKYTKVQSDSRYFKIRYSPSSSRSNLQSQMAMRDATNAANIPEEPGLPPPPSNFIKNGYLHAGDPNVQSSLNSKVAFTNGILLNGYPEYRDNVAINQSLPNVNTDWTQRSGRPTGGMFQDEPTAGNEKTMTPDVRHHNYLHESHHYVPDERIASKIRMVNGHFYPPHQKPSTLPPPTPPRVTFQNDNLPHHFSKTLNSFRPWTQLPPRPNGEVQKSLETPNQNHEMSTEL